ADPRTCCTTRGIPAAYSCRASGGVRGLAGASGVQIHVHPDRCPGLIRQYLDLVADFVDNPEPVYAPGVQGRLATSRERIGNDSLVVDLADNLPGVVPDLQVA